MNSSNEKQHLCYMCKSVFYSTKPVKFCNQCEFAHDNFTSEEEEAPVNNIYLILSPSTLALFEKDTKFKIK